MWVVHLSDLHLGFRAFGTGEADADAREHDVARAFREALREAVRLDPVAVVVSGDVFDRPAPPPSAILTFTRGVEGFRRALPRVPLLLAAGVRDTPLRGSEPGVLASLDALPGVEAAVGSPRSVHLRSADLRVLLVPHRALAPFVAPAPSPDPDARWNVLVLPARPDSSEGGLEIQRSQWSYVALGGEHSARIGQDGGGVAGSLERIGPDPWQEAGREKGFLACHLPTGRVRFHPIPTRPVVDLAPVRARPGEPRALDDGLRDLLEELPGGPVGRLIRVRLASPDEASARALDAGYLDRIRRKAAHLLLAVEPEGRDDEGTESRGTARPHPRASSIRRIRGRTAGPCARMDLTLADGVHVVWSREPGDARAFFALLSTALESEGRREGPLELEREGPDGETGDAPETDLAGWSPWGDVHDEDPERVRNGAIVRLAELVEAQPSAAVPDGGGDVAAASGRPRGVGSSEAEGVAVPTRCTDAPAGGGGGEVDTAGQRIRRLRADYAEAVGDAEEGAMTWLRERQDAETRLQAYRDRARELRRRLREMEGSGPEAPCPTCGRPLGERAGEVLGELREEWESLLQDGRWWSRRRRQLEEKPGKLRRLEARVLGLRTELRENEDALERSRGGSAPAAARRGEPGGDPRTVGSVGAHSPLPGLPRELCEDLASRLDRRAGEVVNRLSGGAYLGVLPREGEPALLRDGVVVEPGDPGDRALLLVAYRLALLELAVEAATARRLPAAVVLPGVEELPGPADRLRLLERLRSMARVVPQVFLILPIDDAEGWAELVEATLEVRRERRGGDLRVRRRRTRAAGVTMV